MALLAIAVFINYVDRGNLATAAPLLQVDLNLSNTQVGLLLSAFYWTYAPMPSESTRTGTTTAPL